ncbi:hypothetical protein AAIH46_05330 [Rhizobium sp. 0TCS1.26]
MMEEWLFISFGIPAIIAVVAYTAVRLYEWDFARRHKHRHPGE